MDKKTKKAFANDPLNLISVEDNANQSKSAQAPHEWMPDNTSYHCTYLERWMLVKKKYNLGVSPREKKFIKNAYSLCES